LNSRIFIEIGLDDVLGLGNPGLLEVVRDLGSRTLLDLNEFIDSHGLGDVRVENILEEHIVTLLSDLLHGPNGLVLIQNTAETEVLESLGKVVSRDLNHTFHRSFSLDFLLWHIEWPGDQIVASHLDMLIEHNLVHGLGKFKVDL
jgi:hypothetical protein